MLTAYCREELNGRTPIQWLIERLTRPEFFFKEQRSEIGHIQRLFIAPKQHIELLRQSPDIMMLDSTYKLNRFKMPLFSICGVSQ